MKNNNTKQRLFEIISKLDNSFKPKLNEFDNYNYPAGADADPNAPWNQVDDNISDVDIYYNNNSNDFMLLAKSENGGYKEYSGLALLEKTNNPELQQYFSQFTNGGLSHEIVRSPEFNAKANDLFDDTVGNGNIEWEYPDGDNEPEYNEYEMNESTNKNEKSKQKLFEMVGKLEGSFKPKLNELGTNNSAGELISNVDNTNNINIEIAALMRGIQVKK